MNTELKFETLLERRVLEFLKRIPVKMLLNFQSFYLKPRL